MAGDFHTYEGTTLVRTPARPSVGHALCDCGWISDRPFSTEREAQHAHAAHAWVAEPYMTS